MAIWKLKDLVERTGASHQALLVLARERRIAHTRKGKDVLFLGDAAEALVAAWERDHEPYLVDRTNRPAAAAPVG
jgi:hypothetical protein